MDIKTHTHTSALLLLLATGARRRSAFVVAFCTIPKCKRIILYHQRADHQKIKPFGLRYVLYASWCKVRSKQRAEAREEEKTECDTICCGDVNTKYRYSSYAVSSALVLPMPLKKYR
jgi:hypothetical protein